jgi:hypothetical protein
MASETPSMIRLQNMRSNICVKAVLPRLLMRLFLIFVAIAG